MNVTGTELVVGLIIYVASVFVCVYLGNEKDAKVLGWEVGLLLGWIGVIIMVCISKSPEKVAREREAANRVQLNQEALRNAWPGTPPASLVIDR